MLVGAGLLVLLLLVVLQMCSALGVWRGAALATSALLLLGSGWYALEWTDRKEQATLVDPAELPPLSSQTCFKCHESHYASWQQSYHRTMTREATPENVKADFNNAIHHYRGITSRLTRSGNRFFMETADPEWEIWNARRGIPFDKAGPERRRVLPVDRLVGSHWFQQMFYRDKEGRYARLPLAYHLVEKRWIHISGAFLAPPQNQLFFTGGAVWNEACVLCHNTRPSINPIPSQLRGGMPGYDTKVGELGIACEACHGPAQRHVLAQQNPARRYSGAADSTIVNPAHLPLALSDEICAHCHSARIPLRASWDRTTQTDPFLAGGKLAGSFYLFWSEAELAGKSPSRSKTAPEAQRPAPPDGKFWGDGTPLTTGVEYQGMALSACYQGGHGSLSCLSCHSMHQSDPNHQLKDGMRTNAACFTCHAAYRDRLVEHTHHAAGSPGSLCYNCHMPYQVYSLLTTHRSHRIAIPRVRDSLGSGKPHACNLCHLDKSLGWTQTQLASWYNTEPVPLSDDERTIASSLLHLARSDARTRVVFAGAFAWPPAQRAGTRDWAVPLLIATLEGERYDAVRYNAYRALRSLYGAAADGYDYQGSPSERADQLRSLRLALERSPRLDPGSYPYLPLTPSGLFSEEIFKRLLRSRNDPDVYINE